MHVSEYEARWGPRYEEVIRLKLTRPSVYARLLRFKRAMGDRLTSELVAEFLDHVKPVAERTPMTEKEKVELPKAL